MSQAIPLDEPLRALVRDVIREEVRAALRDHAALDRRNGGAVGAGGYLSIARAAAFADVAPGTIRAGIRAGRLPSQRAGRVYRVARADLEAFVARSAAERGDVDVHGIARGLAA